VQHQSLVLSRKAITICKNSEIHCHTNGDNVTYQLSLTPFIIGNLIVVILERKKLVPWGTDGRLPLSDVDLDLGSGHTAYHRASLIDLYLRTKFH